MGARNRERERETFCTYIWVFVCVCGRVVYGCLWGEGSICICMFVCGWEVSG